MSSLSLHDKRLLEELLGMSSGYVLNFTDATFGKFMFDVAEIDIHDKKYTTEGTSKAKKLRRFWDVESDEVVGKAIEQLIIVACEYDFENKLEDLASKCQLIATRILSGRVNLKPLKTSAQVLNSKYIAEQIHRMEQAVEKDPPLAIGTAKELIETCCKTILAERGKPVQGCPDIPVLTKSTLKELRLVPEGVSEATRGREQIIRLLQSLGMIGNNLAELRGLYGTGHGRSADTNNLPTIHAKLIVGAASTLVTFLFDIHKETK